jgi:hypothetical protein
MNVERDKLRDIVISVGAVGLFIAVLMIIGTSFDSGGLTQQGAYALLGTIVGFVVMMSAIGYWLAYQN